MKNKKSMAIGLLGLLGIATARADTNSWARIIGYKYEPIRQDAIITSETQPSNSIWKIIYSNSLTTNTTWKEYANVIQGGRTNVTRVYSPTKQRFYRLRLRE